ncbi:GIY-YIG nuclease family protein [Microdochium nivale]|nr:GIY-YIG nuclease family protein [Microdochium nivale]
MLSPRCEMGAKLCRPLDDMDAMPGRLYVFRRRFSPGYIKIGWTAHAADRRMRAWARQCGYEPVLVHSTDLIPNAQRAEALAWERRKERRCGGCGQMHIEWFEVGEERAMQVVDSWAALMARAKGDENGEENGEGGVYSEDGRIRDGWARAVSALAGKKEGEWAGSITAQRLQESYDRAREGRRQLEKTNAARLWASQDTLVRQNLVIADPSGPARTKVNKEETWNGAQAKGHDEAIAIENVPQSHEDLTEQTPLVASARVAQVDEEIRTSVETHDNNLNGEQSTTTQDLDDICTLVAQSAPRAFTHSDEMRQENREGVPNNDDNHRDEELTTTEEIHDTHEVLIEQHPVAKTTLTLAETKEEIREVDEQPHDKHSHGDTITAEHPPKFDEVLPEQQLLPAPAAIFTVGEVGETRQRTAKQLKEEHSLHEQQ